MLKNRMLLTHLGLRMRMISVNGLFPFSSFTHQPYSLHVPILFTSNDTAGQRIPLESDPRFTVPLRTTCPLVEYVCTCASTQRTADAWKCTSQSAMNYYFYTQTSGGHFGRDKTIGKILDCFYWPKLADVRHLMQAYTPDCGLFAIAFAVGC